MDKVFIFVPQIRVPASIGITYHKRKRIYKSQLVYCVRILIFCSILVCIWYKQYVAVLLCLRSRDATNKGFVSRFNHSVVSGIRTLHTNTKCIATNAIQRVLSPIQIRILNTLTNCPILRFFRQTGSQQHSMLYVLGKERVMLHQGG